MVFVIKVSPLSCPDNYETDVYNPEAPSITNTSRPLYRHRVNAQRPNLIGLTMGDVDQPQRGIHIYSHQLNIWVLSRLSYKMHVLPSSVSLIISLLNTLTIPMACYCFTNKKKSCVYYTLLFFLFFWCTVCCSLRTDLLLSFPNQTRFLTTVWGSLWRLIRGRD